MNREDVELLAAKLKEADGLISTGKVKSASLEITVHRHATGKDENIGLVSYYNKNPIKHYYINLLIWLRGKYRSWRQLSLQKVKK